MFFYLQTQKTRPKSIFKCVYWSMRPGAVQDRTNRVWMQSTWKRLYCGFKFECLLDVVVSTGVMSDRLLHSCITTSLNKGNIQAKCEIQTFHPTAQQYMFHSIKDQRAPPSHDPLIQARVWPQIFFRPLKRSHFLFYRSVKPKTTIPLPSRPVSGAWVRPADWLRTAEFHLPLLGLRW